MQIILLSGKLELIFHKSLSMTLRQARLTYYRPAEINASDGLLPSTTYYFNSICRCLFTHVVFIIPPPAGHLCPLSALEHAMSSLSTLQLKRDLKDSYTRFRTVG